MVIVRRRKICRALNDICSIYFNVKKSVAPPKNRIFKPAIILAIITIFVGVVRTVIGLIYVKFSGYVYKKEKRKTTIPHFLNNRKKYLTSNIFTKFQFVSVLILDFRCRFYCFLYRDELSCCFNLSSGK